MATDIVIGKNGIHKFIDRASGAEESANNIIAGNYYLHKNHHSIRVIWKIENDIVFWEDLENPNYYPGGSCSRDSLIRACPTMATKAEIEFILNKK